MELSYYGKVIKLLQQYDPQGLITQGELAQELLELSASFLAES